jgi:hypothetical protein
MREKTATPKRLAAALGGDMRAGRDDLVRRAETIAAELAAAGVHVDLPTGGVAAIIDEAIDLLALRKVLRRSGSLLEVAAGESGLIGFYAAPIRQHLAATAA